MNLIVNRSIQICMILVIPFTLSAQKKDITQVEKSMELLKQLMMFLSLDGLNKIVDDKLSYGHSSGFVENKASFINKLVSGDSDFVTIDNTDQEIIINGKTALVRNILSATTNDKGVAGQIKLKILYVWVKQKKAWKLLGRQAVKIIN